MKLLDWNSWFKTSTPKYPSLQTRIEEFDKKVTEVTNRASMALEQAQTLFSNDHRLITYEVLCDIGYGEVLDLDGIKVTRLEEDGCVFKSVWEKDASTRIHFHNFVENVTLIKGRLWVNGLEIIHSFDIATNQEHILTAEKGTVVRVMLNEPS